MKNNIYWRKNSCNLCLHLSMIRFSRETGEKNVSSEKRIIQILSKKTPWKMKTTWFLVNVFIYLVKHGGKTRLPCAGSCFPVRHQAVVLQNYTVNIVNTKFMGTRKNLEWNQLGIKGIAWKGHAFWLWDETTTITLRKKKWLPRCDFFFLKTEKLMYDHPSALMRIGLK